jgi:hypothetical protein
VNLILTEKTLLIAPDDEEGHDTTRWGLDAGLAGALLLDLARLELLSLDAEGKSPRSMVLSRGRGQVVLRSRVGPARPRAGPRYVYGDPRII